MNPFLLWCVIFDSSELLHTITGVYLTFEGLFCGSAEFRCLELLCYFRVDSFWPLNQNFKVKRGLDCICYASCMLYECHVQCTSCFGHASELRVGFIQRNIVENKFSMS